MKVISAPIPNSPKIIAGIGFFDGVHIGHQSLINSIKSTAQTNNTASAVVTFRRHPRTVLSSDYRPQLLNDFEEKLQHLEETGIDYVIALDFDTKMSEMSG